MIYLDNPFIKNGFLLPTASVNKLMISKINNCSENINKYAAELFSSSVLHDSVYSLLHSNGISFTEKNMFDVFKMYLAENSENNLCIKAQDILKTLGKNLVYILLSLYEGLNENRLLRDDWVSAHWDYWHNINKIYLCGGFMQDIIGEKIVRYAEDYFLNISCHPYEIIIEKDNLPLIGACKYGTLFSESNVVFDFGHSYIKRCYYINENGCYSIKLLPPIKSKYLEPECSPEDLDNFLVETILNTFDEAPVLLKKSHVITACIANYINNGDIYEKRGNYSKLKRLTDNYQKYLSGKLTDKLNLKIEVILMHDGSAAAYVVNENNCAVLTLGTAIGVGFTSNNFNFNYKLI